MIIQGFESNGRFGFALAAMGDINLDRYNGNELFRLTSVSLNSGKTVGYIKICYSVKFYIGDPREDSWSDLLH